MGRWWFGRATWCRAQPGHQRWAARSDASVPLPACVMGTRVRGDLTAAGDLLGGRQAVEVGAVREGIGHDVPPWCDANSGDDHQCHLDSNIEFSTRQYCNEINVK